MKFDQIAAVCHHLVMRLRLVYHCKTFHTYFVYLKILSADCIAFRFSFMFKKLL